MGSSGDLDEDSMLDEAPRTVKKKSAWQIEQEMDDAFSDAIGIDEGFGAARSHGWGGGTDDHGPRPGAQQQQQQQPPMTSFASIDLGSSGRRSSGHSSSGMATYVADTDSSNACRYALRASLVVVMLPGADP